MILHQTDLHTVDYGRLFLSIPDALKSPSYPQCRTSTLEISVFVFDFDILEIGNVSVCCLQVVHLQNVKTTQEACISVYTFRNVLRRHLSPDQRHGGVYVVGSSLSTLSGLVLHKEKLRGVRPCLLHRPIYRSLLVRLGINRHNTKMCRLIRHRYFGHGPSTEKPAIKTRKSLVKVGEVE